MQHTHHQPSTPARRIRRSALGVALAVATTLGGALVDAGAVAAERVELAVNELAPQISTWSSTALVALDHLEQHPDDAAALAQYETYRSLAAYYTATQIGYDHAPMIEAWAETTPVHQRALLSALSQVGVPYRSMTSKEGVGFDCSGLTFYAWGGAGVQLFRSSGDQISDAAKLSREEAKAGDLVYYPGHVMMYLGVDDAIVHSIQTGRSVEIDTIAQGRRSSVRFGDPIAG